MRQRFVLGYVNYEDDTVKDYDRTFDSYPELEAFVSSEAQGVPGRVTSFGVVVLFSWDKKGAQ